MYLLDTNVVSEWRKGARANRGVLSFMREKRGAQADVYISSITLGELRHGLELVRHRGDGPQTLLLERWFQEVTGAFGKILPFDEIAAQVWGRLLVPHPENSIDKQIAAIALVNSLTVVTRNVSDFKPTGVRLENPFA